MAPGRDGALIASERGLFVASTDGNVVLRAEREGGFIALASDRSNVDVLYASGRSGGLLRSQDAGVNWKPTAPGGPDSFSTLAAGPAILYGVADALYQSADGGQHWRRSGATPDKLISLAVSLRDPQTLFAGTEEGMLSSSDGGARWQPMTTAAGRRLPVSLIRTDGAGNFFRFDWGHGLSRTRNPARAWTALNNRFGGQALLQLVSVGRDLMASTTAAKLFVSRDGGKSWQPLGGFPKAVTAAARRGAKLFATHCQVCHGDNGIGQAPQGASPQTLAPALDETAHAWHHTDTQLEQTILQGMPAPSPMQGWAGRLKPSDVKDIVAYMKSLWTERALRCQGPKHMDPGCMG